MAYSGIDFLYSEFAADVERLRKLAAPFLDEQGTRALHQYQTTIENCRQVPINGRASLGIREDYPVKTKTSDGNYRRREASGLPSVYGTLCCRWDITRRNTAQRDRQTFSLDGMASTSLRIFKADDHSPVAVWQIETGDSTSPGCHFHSAMNQYGSNGMFPSWLKVPRLPGVLATPMDALEFLLAELFQTDWHRTVSTRSDARDAWSSAQQQRLRRLISWQLSKVNTDDGTPWMTLKLAKPPANVFLE